MLYFILKMHNIIFTLCLGYGFLSENEHFAAALERNGIIFVGPTVANLHQFGDKTMARELAIALDVPVIRGSDEAFLTWVEARDWIAKEMAEERMNYPVIVKAAMGGMIITYMYFCIAPSIKIIIHSSNLLKVEVEVYG